MEWSELEVILAVCRAGSLSGAARKLDLNHSTVFRKINAIEERTQVRFFERMASGYQMTAAGETALVHAERIENEMHALGREVLGQDTRLEGRIRVTAPEGMAAILLPEALVRFSQQHPGVSVEIVGTADALDLSKREAEVAIRATRKAPESALGRRVCPFRFGIYGAPSYLDEREGEELAALAELDWVLLTGMEKWLVPRVWKKQVDARERTILSSSSIVSVVNATARGAGVTMLPYYLGEEEPRLRRVGGPLEDWQLELWVLTHPDLRHTVRVKALMSYLYDFLRERRHIFEGRD
jgi:DNA-binding transcriptional LysR family regulator